jgi:septal ring factor EnvC (AmiA/AmiB activator)
MAKEYGPGYNGPLLTATKLSPPAHPSQEYEDKYNQAKANQADLERKQKKLTAESNSLKAQQASLERQAAQLRAQRAALQRQLAPLQGRRRSSRPRNAAFSSAGCRSGSRPWRSGRRSGPTSGRRPRSPPG